MRVTRDMIDDDLWRSTRGIRLLVRVLGSGKKPGAYEKSSRRIQRMSKRFEGRNVAGLDCSTEWIDRPDGTKLRVRIYRPIGQDRDLTGVLWIHGGGYAIGSPETVGSRFGQLIGTRPAVIVSPDYRLSIEAPYPAALDDCYLTLKWMKDQASRLRITDDQLFVGGESAGGGLTAATTLYARDKGEVAVAFQMPLYPMIDDRVTDSARDNTAPIWSAAQNRPAWALYLGPLSGSDDVPAYAAPARATDYAGLPPTYTFVGDIEPFHDETVRYVENLRAAGVPVEFELYSGAFHGFDGIAPKAELSKLANARTLEAYALAVDTLRAAQPA